MLPKLQLQKNKYNQSIGVKNKQGQKASSMVSEMNRKQQLELLSCIQVNTQSILGVQADRQWLQVKL